MHILLSILIAAKLIGGCGNIQADTFCTDIMNLLQNNCTNSQVIIGNASDIESILGELGFTIDSETGCIKPSVPDSCTPGTDDSDDQTDITDTETPDCGTNAPDVTLPDNDTNKPETTIPDNGSNKPETTTPDNGSNKPETTTPDNGSNKPETTTPDNGSNKPETTIPDNGSNKPETTTPDNGSNKPETTTPDNSNTDSEQNTNKSYVEQVVDLVNKERAKANLPALTMSNSLNNAAYTRAKETVKVFSHTRPNGSSFSTVLKENGISYRGAGENIAWGQRTPEAVVNAWMNSEGHRANILNKNYTSIGVGYYLNGSTPYWTQLFTY